jgi:RNA polymerase sigma factor (sigma-70 family)
MDSRQSGALVRHLRQLVDPRAAGDLSDAALLLRFAAGRDEGAFAALVQRHGTLVRNVCRHVLHDDHDAEDAFQGTFLVLARKAGSIRKRESVAGWLHGVAYRVAQKARVAAARRRVHETRAAASPASQPPCEMAWRELQAILDDELNHLQEKYRTPFVLCCLEGKSKKEAAEELGWKEGTVSSRLAEARKRLQQRLQGRGVTLSSVLCGTALSQTTAVTISPLLTDGTVKAASSFVSGAGVEGGGGVAVAEGVLQAMEATRIKLAIAFAALLVLAGATWALLPRFRDGKPLDEAQAHIDPSPEEPVPQVQTALNGDGTMIVTGRILSPDGQPLAGAQVAVMATEFRHFSMSAVDYRPNQRVLRTGQADDQGRFLLSVERPSLEKYFLVGLLASAPGHAPLWSSVSHRDSYHHPQEVSCKLEPGQCVRGRLVDVRGKPAPGVRIDVLGMVSPVQALRFRGPQENLRSWIASVTTDEAGRFVLRNIGPRSAVELLVQDARFAPQWLQVRSGPKESDDETTLPLAPKRVLEGRVIAADTSRPIPRALLFVYSTGAGAALRLNRAETHADNEGRFQLSPYPGEDLQIVAYPTRGEPYMNLGKPLKWPGTTGREVIGLSLPRGVLVTGRVVDDSTDQPIAGAKVEYRSLTGDDDPRARTQPDGSAVQWGWLNTDTSQDGTFRLALLPGRGWLLAKGPGVEYVHGEVSAEQLVGRKAGGTPFFPDALLPIDLKPNAELKDVVLRLRRGVTLSGKVVGPTGEPVEAAFVLASSFMPSRSFELRGDALPVRQGQFEIQGCDPEKTVPALFYDSGNRQGAFAELSPKRVASEPVRLAACGSASVRFVDPAGKPVPRPIVQVEVVLRQGPTILESYDQGGPASITVPAGRFFGAESIRHDSRTGITTLTCLIPGATYLLQADEPRGRVRKATLTVQPGEQRTLPDIVIQNAR